METSIVGHTQILDRATVQKTEVFTGLRVTPALSPQLLAATLAMVALHDHNQEGDASV